MRIFVTGGAGFIGSALVRHLIENTDHEVLNFDKLTYAGTLSTVERVANSNRYRFVQGDICDAETVKAAIALFRVEGRIGPSRPRLGPHLWLAGARHQLLEQLRPLSLP